jgi:hypothetical protein
MRRFVPILIAGVALIAAACRDSIAPTRSVGLSKFGGPVAFSTAVGGEQYRTTTFTIEPSGGVVRVGDFVLAFPANAVCDPSTSGYGPDTWDLACQTLDVPIAITATFWWKDKIAYVDFSPDIRFSPDKSVLISTRRGAKTSDDLAQFTMWYFKTVDNVRYFIDEAAVDADVATKHDFSTKRVWRRVKHFSGISLSSGQPCDDTVGDPDCVSDDGSMQGGGGGS